MDAEFEGEAEAAEEQWDKRRPKRKRKKQTTDDGAKQELERQELEERLKGELFRYREVEPVDFGLTTEEVVIAPNSTQ